MSRLPGCLILVLLAGTSTLTQAWANAAAPEAPMTLARALKLGLDGLVGHNDPSEVGQDHAAQLYAAARRIQTENTLAQKNLEQVLVLDDFRDAISKCRSGSYDLAYIVNGGGTMYSHGEARDGAEVEDFLAGLAKSLPLAEGKGSPGANAKIDADIAFLKTLKAYDSGDAAADREANAHLTTERDHAIEQWENLRYRVSEIPAVPADKIVAFAEDSMSWLKEQ